MQDDGRPLDGVRVLDFTRVLAGPYATALMADLGADVVKVEGLDGDDYRHIGPFREGESALFQTVNRGKRSIVLDLKAPTDVALARRLAARADVLVENFRPGVMEKLGLGAEALQGINPGLIYASISGFGQDGPDAARPAYDVIVQAMSGIMEQTGVADGPPTMVGEAVADVAGGLFGAWGIMVALYERERTGRGRRIDLALFDALASMMPTAAARVLVCDEDPRRTGNRHAISAPFGTYAAREGHFTVAVLNDRLFTAFCAAIGRPELIADPRFTSDSNRRVHEPLLARAIEEWAAELSADEAVARLAAAGVPTSALATPRAVWKSARVRQRGLVSDVTHAVSGTLSLPEQPVHFGGCPRGERKAAPALDEHGAAIRAEMEELL